jgi:ATP-dependent Zn protease
LDLEKGAQLLLEKEKIDGEEITALMAYSISYSHPVNLLNFSP